MTTLTETEIEVLKLVAKGMSNAQIALNRHVTEGTIKNELRYIFRILNAINRVSAVRIAIKQGTISLDDFLNE